MVIENNPYLDEAIDKFLLAYSKREEMEHNFHSGMLEEYTSVNQQVVSLAGEMIKYGLDVYQKDDNFCFIIDNVEYAITIDELCQVLSDEEFKTMKESISKREARKAEAQQQEDETTETKEDNDESQNNTTENDESADKNIDNPITQLFQLMFKAVSGEDNFQPPVPTPAKEEPEKDKPSLFDDITSIQKRVLQLEHEKYVAESLETKLSESVEEYKLRIQNKEDELKQKEEEISSLIQDKKAAEELLEEISRDFELVRSERDSVKQQVAESNTAITRRNEECNRLKSRITELEAKYNKLKSDYDGKCRDLDNLRRELSKKTDELNAIQESLKTNNAKSEQDKAAVIKEKTELQEKVGSLTKERDDAKKEAEKLKEECKKALEDSEKAQKDATALKSELASTKNELNATKSKVKSLENQAKKAKDEPAMMDEETAKKLDELTLENTRLQRELERVKSQPSEEQIRKAGAVYEEKIAMLQKLAYTDEKFGVKNSNAFNVDYPSKDKDKITISMVGICNMKIFNNTFGRAKGDIAIKKVAQMLIDAFPSSDIYRIMGDQFTILSENMDIVSIKNKLQDIETALEGDMINIVYGTVDGVACKDHETALKQAESAMKQMKSRSGKSSITRKNLAEMEKAKEEQNFKAAKQKADAAEQEEDTNENNSGEEITEELQDEDDEAVTVKTVDDEEDDDEEVVINVDEEPTKTNKSSKSNKSKTSPKGSQKAKEPEEDEDDEDVDFEVDYEDLMDEIEDDDD